MQGLRDRLIRIDHDLMIPIEFEGEAFDRVCLYNMEKTKILFELLAVRALETEFDKQDINLVKDGYLSWMSLDAKFTVFFDKHYGNKFKNTNPCDYGFHMNSLEEKMDWTRHHNNLFIHPQILLDFVDEKDLYMYTKVHPHWFFKIQYSESMIH